MKKLVCCLLLLAVGAWVGTPTTFAQSSKKTTSKVKSIDATYRIRLGAFAKPIEISAFQGLFDLGVVTFEPADNGYVRAYLGTYMGKSTASKILAIAKKRGYKDAYIARDNYLFENSMGEQLTQTFQFSAAKKLDARQVVEGLLAEDTRLSDENLYILFDGSYYHYSLGLFAPHMTAQIDSYDAFATKMGFNEGYERSFRKGTANGAATAPVTKPTEPKTPVVTTPPTPTTPTKPATTNPKTDKMNQGNATTAASDSIKTVVSATTQSKTDKMSGKVNTTSKSDKMSGKKATTTTTTPASDTTKTTKTTTVAPK